MARIKIYNDIYNGTDITNVCEYSTLSNIESLGGDYVKGFVNSKETKGISNVFSNSFQAFWKQADTYTDECLYEDPLNQKFQVNGKPQIFVPKNGLIKNYIKSFTGATADSSSSTTYYFRTNWIPDSNNYNLYYSTNQSTWNLIASNIRSFNVEFCGSGASGTYAKFTAGAFAASCDGGGGGGGAGSVVIKIIPTHKNTSGVIHIYDCNLGKQTRTEDSQFTTINRWLYAGAWGHNSVDGNDSNVKIGGITITAGKGIGGSGSRGGSGGSSYITIPNINNGSRFTINEVPFGINTNTSGFTTNWSYTNDSYVTTRNSAWFVVKSTDGEDLFKWNISHFINGARGGNKLNSGSGISTSYKLNNNINNSSFSVNWSGGNGFDAADPAAPAGGGASMFGSGGGWSDYDTGWGSIYFGSLFGMGNFGVTYAGYGAGGASGIACKIFVSVLPTGGNCAWVTPGWGGQSCLRIRY